jgi:hypothetical protein
MTFWIVLWATMGAVGVVLVLAVIASAILIVHELLKEESDDRKSEAIDE